MSRPANTADDEPPITVRVMSCAPAVRDEIRRGMEEFSIAPEAVARAIAFAIEQPRDVEIGDITLPHGSGLITSGRRLQVGRRHRDDHAENQPSPAEQ